MSGEKNAKFRMKIDEIMQRDPFGEKLITITAKNLNATQISHFLQRMHELETPSGKPYMNNSSGPFCRLSRIEKQSSGE